MRFADGGEGGDSNKDDVSGCRLSYWPECVPRSDEEARSDFGGIGPNKMSMVLENGVAHLRKWQQVGRSADGVSSKQVGRSAYGVSSKDQAPEERTSWHFLCQ